jgi:hypothetical protein
MVESVVKHHKTKPNHFKLNSNSFGSVNYLIRPNYFIQKKEKYWYCITVYKTIKGYLAVAS